MVVDLIRGVLWAFFITVRNALRRLGDECNTKDDPLATPSGSKGAGE